MILFNGEQNSYQQTNISDLTNSIVNNQIHMLALNLVHRKEDGIPVDSIITTYLQ